MTTQPAADSKPQPQGSYMVWRQALAALAIVWLSTLLFYADSAAAMVGIWWSSETFAHAFIVPPISLWLIWRQRELLAAMVPRPAPWLLVPLLLLGLMWLAGDLVVANSVTQFALVAALVVAVPLVLGLQVASAITFPLMFLFFAVPVGEFLLPTLMEATADFTVAALILSGIPVYREGLQFVIPSGNWSVVEACSGVRYLIASMMVGTLFAYLNYRSTWRRMAFIGVSIVMPIVANWVRAYMIVMIGHLSSNTLAVGVDHLIYGWVFFGVVIMLMFWVGARWSEPEATAHELMAALPSEGSAITPTRRRWAAVVVLSVATIGVSVVSKLWLDRDAHAVAEPRLSLPTSFGTWQGSDGTQVDWSPRFERPTAQQQRNYVGSSGAIGVYVAYYRAQSYDSKLVSSRNSLAPTEEHAWNLMTLSSPEVTIAGQKVRLRASSLQGPPGLSQNPRPQIVAWQIYWIDDKLTASDYLAKVYTALARLGGRGDDGASIVLYAQGNDEKQTTAQLDQFTQEHLPELLQALRKTRAQR